jgi:signal transduction histidine kinase
MFFVRLTRTFGATSFRLAAIYTLLLAGSVVVLGVVVFFSARVAMREQLREGVAAEVGALRAAYEDDGLAKVVHLVRERERSPAALDYRLEDARGRLLAGDLPTAGPGLGWSTVVEPESGDDEEERLLVLTVRLGRDGLLTVGDDVAQIEDTDEAILRAFGVAFVVLLVLGAAGGVFLSRSFLRRVDAITATAEAIMDGDLSRRIPVGADVTDELGHLGVTLNRMLDRTQSLMESLRQVSDDIAHDLRTPLTRLRQGLEAALTQTRDADELKVAVGAAVAETDAILETFAALLRIAQIEAGSRRAAFRELDLSEIATLVVEAFAPSAEEQGRTIVNIAEEPVRVAGDRELLTQMLVNLVENALRHTPPGAAIAVRTSREATGSVLAVVDDGPGVPAVAREAVLRRFYRLDRSRTTPGDGLGLSLVDAVARLHGGQVELADARPGLIASVRFPATAP